MLWLVTHHHQSLLPPVGHRAVVSDSTAVYYVSSDCNILSKRLRDKIPKMFNGLDLHVIKLNQTFILFTR